MKLTKVIAVVLTASAILLSNAGFAAEVIVNAQTRVYAPDIVYIQPGDTVQWTNMTSHNAVSYVLPEGANGFGEKGKLPGGSFNATIEKEGIYGYVCEPHIGFGMVGVIAVGKITAEMKDAAVKTAEATLEGPFRRLIGTLKKVEVK